VVLVIVMKNFSVLISMFALLGACGGQTTSDTGGGANAPGGSGGTAGGAATPQGGGLAGGAGAPASGGSPGAGNGGSGVVANGGSSGVGGSGAAGVGGSGGVAGMNDCVGLCAAFGALPCYGGGIDGCQKFCGQLPPCPSFQPLIDCMKANPPFCDSPDDKTVDYGACGPLQAKLCKPLASSRLCSSP
jgi:hypothetical protein